jgi:hypothetical protein
MRRSPRFSKLPRRRDELQDFIVKIPFCFTHSLPFPEEQST